MKLIRLAAVLLLGAAPSGVSEVFDGLGSDEDFTPAGTLLSANWTLLSGDDYQVAVGTTPGGTEIQPFTSVGITSSATTTVAAVAGSIYYITVKSFLGAAEVDSQTSDGITAIGPSSVTGAPTSGNAPLLVQFAAQLPGVALYEWDFDLPFSIGKGKPMAFSSLATPGVDYSDASSGNASFTYTLPGAYDATLTLTHAGGGVTSIVVPITVAAAPGAPSVGVTADVSSGPAPLTVTLTAAVTAEVGAYFWDFDGDGSFDASSDSSPVIVHTFTQPGSYNVTATVVDPTGAGASSPAVLITVLDPGGVPFVTGFVATANSFRTGDPIAFAASGDPNGAGAIVSFTWDFDGNGEVDLVTPTGTATWQYPEPGSYNARVTVTDDENLAASSVTAVNIALSPGTPRVWLTEPANGLRVYGNFVSLTAQAVPAESVTGVDFYYRPAGAGPAVFPDASWILINATPVLPPPTSEFGTHWDVTGLVPGAPGYDLLAVATFPGPLQAASLAVPTTVEVDPVSPDLLENSGSPFTKLKTQGVNPNAAAHVGISRDTTLQLQAGATTGYDQMRIERRSENPHPVETTLQGLRFVPGHFRRKTFASGQKPKKPSKVSMYLNTGGSDILPDGTDLNASTFRIMRFNEAKRRWEPLYGQAFNPSQKLIKAFTASTGDVAIAVISSRTASSSSSSSGCGLLGLEAFAAALAAAALGRRLRRRN